MRHARSIKLAALAISLLFLTSCTATRVQISDGRYVSPLDNFVVPIPKGIGQRVQDDGDKDSGSVSFHDDLGSLKSIFYTRLLPEQIPNEPEKQRKYFENFLNEFVMSWLIRPKFPDASILHQEHLNLDNGNAYFALVEIPEGSTMFDVRASRRYDTTRGLLIFKNDKFMYMLSSGENPSVYDLGEPSKTLDKLVEQEKMKLLSFRSQIDFN